MILQLFSVPPAWAGGYDAADDHLHLHPGAGRHRLVPAQPPVPGDDDDSMMKGLIKICDRAD